jgi:DNA-binding SARP family transcriptional activator
VGIAILRQDVLPDWPDEWLIATREWFRQIRLRALEALSDRHRAAGRMDAALAAGLAAVSSDLLRESAHRRLAQVHIAEGNFAEALRQYQSYRRLARSELGLPPFPQFRTLIAPLLNRPLGRAWSSRLARAAGAHSWPCSHSQATAKMITAQKSQCSRSALIPEAADLAPDLALFMNRYAASSLEPSAPPMKASTKPIAMSPSA